MQLPQVRVEILVAIIGVVGAVLAAIVGALMSRTRAREHDRERQVAAPRMPPLGPAGRPRVGNLSDFFATTNANESRLDIQIAVTHGNQIVVFYTLPLRVHVKRLEWIAQDRTLVFVSDENVRLDVGAAIPQHVSDAFATVTEKQATLARALPGEGGKLEILSETTVPFAVYPSTSHP